MKWCRNTHYYTLILLAELVLRAPFPSLPYVLFIKQLKLSSGQTTIYTCTTLFVPFSCPAIALETYRTEFPHRLSCVIIYSQIYMSFMAQSFTPKMTYPVLQSCWRMGSDWPCLCASACDIFEGTASAHLAIGVSVAGNWSLVFGNCMYWEL